MNRKTVKAIMTLYYPDENNINNIALIAKQVNRLFVVDNTPLANGYEGLNIDNVTYISLGRNVGQPKAFNTVLKNYHYVWSDDDYVIFFDQDTIIPDNYIERLIQIFELLLGNDFKIGCLGPVYYNVSSGKMEMQHIKQKVIDGCYIVEDIIESSLLAKYKVLKEVDFWNEEFFLDGDDWDLCWRIRNKGYKIFKTDRISITHSIGEEEANFWFFKMRRQAPVRLYYRIRESLKLLAKNYTPIRMKLSLAVDIYFINLFRILLLDDKQKRFKYLKRGWEDYNNGICGEYKES